MAVSYGTDIFMWMPVLTQTDVTQDAVPFFAWNSSHRITEVQFPLVLATREWTKQRGDSSWQKMILFHEKKLILCLEKNPCIFLEETWSFLTRCNYIMSCRIYRDQNNPGIVWYLESNANLQLLWNRLRIRGGDLDDLKN